MSKQLRAFGFWLAGIALACVCAAEATVEEVPFITTPDHVTLEMLGAARVGPGDHVIDLGSGDGRIVITAARRFGATGLGVDIDPALVKQSRRNASEAGVADRVEFREQDLFATDLSRATVVTMYLLPEVNLQLRPRLLQLAAGTRIVSHDWDMGDWLPDRTTVLPVPDKKVGLDKSSKVHLWTVPAQVEGLWCGTGPLASARLRLSQRYQQVHGSLSRGGREQTLAGRLQGTLLRAETAGERLELQAQGGELRVARSGGAFAAGQSWRRAAGADCG